MNYKLLGDYKSHYMIQHPDGKTIPIAKAGLSEETHAKIRAMGGPLKMAYGGVVPGVADSSQEQAPAPDPVAASQSDQPVSDPNSIASAQSSQPIPDPTDQGATVPVSDFASAKGVSPDDTPQPQTGSVFTDIAKQFVPGGALPAQAGAPTSSTSPAPSQNSKLTNASYDSGAPDKPMSSDSNAKQGLPGSYGAQMGALDKGQDAMSQFTKSMNDANKDSESARQSLVNGQAIIDQTHQKNLQALNQEQHDLGTKMMTGQVDPNRMWNSMGTGNKILAGIAVALGGLGSNGSGTNAALGVINNAINRDIDAQKTDLEKNKFALSANRDAQNSENMDYAQKKASLITTAQAQIGMAAAKSQNASASLQAQNMVSQLELQKQSLLNDYSMKKSVFDAVQANPGDPGVLGRAISTVVPEKQQDQAFKELDRIGAAYKAKDAINKYMGSANDKNTIMGRLVHGGFEPADMGALEANVMPVIKDMEGRVNEREMDVLHKLYPAPGDAPDKVRTKMMGLNDFVNSKTQSSMLSAYGLMPKYNGAYTSTGQKRFNEGTPKLQ
jgi:hypothetical protein